MAENENIINDEIEQVDNTSSITEQNELNDPSELGEPIEPNDIPEPKEPETQPEIMLDKNGEVSYSDEFWDNKFKDKDDSTVSTKNATSTTEKEATIPTSHAEQDLYTDDELNTTPYEQWDINRLPPDVRKYAQVVRQQLILQAQTRAQLQQAQQSQQQNQQQATQTPQTEQAQQPPKMYTPRELADEATKLALKNLGLDEDSEIELYDPEHLAAYNMAADELKSRRQAEISNYNLRHETYNQLQQYHQQLSAQTDFKEFDGWIGAKLQKNGLTYNDLNSRLESIVKAYGGDYRPVISALNSWYDEFKSAKTSNAKIRTSNLNRTAKTPRPPVLERSTGAPESLNHSGLKDLKAFSAMGMDEQAQMIEKWGLI